MKILITGGAGFQGSHLAESLLDQGHEISILNTYSKTALSNLENVLDRVILIWGTVADKELVDKSVRGHDVAIHLAAHVNVDESLEDPSIFFYVNILGTFYVLEAVRKHNSRLIYISTCEVYGDGHTLKEGELLDESSELRPNSPYAASKASADRICHSYFKSYGTDVNIVRPFNLFGERQKSSRFGALIPILVSKALRGEDLIIFGDGNATRDYTHVSDIIEGYNIVLNTPTLKGKVINFASGTNTKIKDIVEYIAKKLNVKVRHSAPRPGEVSRFPADTSFARSLGYSPKVSIWDGIDRYIAWAKQNR